ncbi:hypothetical protein NHX12_016677 [Muraenolepis orangiensis]|uniref:Uncharacterized protein n=1 Tax=Muraenolepis orangiensis TaxID=630683 RepID=A0A9Q0D3X8_9TELE|nr:hypothetical protein NHX12_016688 [Muraenolepis orangiensis]KAJ3581408.1 hypothetical protein NHX12_016677 [Muraenolepis orangiensis]
MVRFLSCMDELVSLQITRLTKGFPTLITTVASGSVYWNLARFLDGSRGGSDWLLRGGCDVWEETSFQFDFSAPQQSAVQIPVAPLHVFMEEDLSREGVRTFWTGEHLRWCRLGFHS